MGKQKLNKKKKILLIIGGVIVAIILIAVIAISIIADKNVKAMNSCIDAVLDELKENYTITPVDAGEYKEMSIYGIMKFDVEQYDIADIGNLSIMRMNMGLMQMSTIVITPIDKNLPLFSADYLYILSNRKAYLEFYDVVEEKDSQYNGLMEELADVQEKYTHLDNFEASEAWYESLLTVVSYKSGTLDDDEELQNILMDSLSTYIKHSNDFPVLSTEDREEKLNITIEYTDGLIEKGGVSTDVFKKELGPEETKKFFDQVFFGTARY